MKKTKKKNIIKHSKKSRETFETCPFNEFDIYQHTHTHTHLALKYINLGCEVNGHLLVSCFCFTSRSESRSALRFVSIYVYVCPALSCTSASNTPHDLCNEFLINVQCSGIFFV